MPQRNIPENKKRAPTWYWVLLALIVVASIIAYILLQNDGRTDQINTEEQTTYQAPAPKRYLI